jgi:hypothetical protein
MQENSTGLGEKVFSLNFDIYFGWKIYVSQKIVGKVNLFETGDFRDSAHPESIRRASEAKIASFITPEWVIRLGDARRLLRCEISEQKGRITGPCALTQSPLEASLSVFV